MIPRRLGSTGILVSPIGFGAFKIGRNEGIKYDRGYDLPTLDETARLLHGILDLGVTWIDTAPAYGVSEERIGQTIASRRREYTLSTKVGETFADGRSTYDFSHLAVRESLSRSLERLKTDVVEIVFVHSDGRDLEILERGETTTALREARASGCVRRLGFSGKTEAGFLRAMDDGYEVLMVERHPRDVSMDRVIAEAARRGVGVVIKKPLASGAIAPETAIPFGLAPAGVASLAIGGVNLERFRGHVALAAEL